MKQDAVPNVENFPLAVGNIGSHSKSSNHKTTMWCGHSNKACHTSDSCWKLHGKPANWKVSPEGITKAFSQEQISYIQKLLKHKSESSSAPNGSFAQSGSNPNVFLCFYPSNSTPWIIDFVASDHMTSLSHLFHTYKPCSGHERVHIAVGSFSPIAAKGSVFLSPTVCLKPLLHVPKLACNLLSVSKLAQDSNCSVSFSSPIVSFRNKLRER